MDYIQFVLAPQMLNGLAFGIAVILMALGLTIIFGLLDVINMSHGEFYAVGAYLGFVLIAAGLNFWVAVVLVPLLMIPLGIAIERLLIRRIYDSPDRHTLTLLLTLGLSMVVVDLLKIVFGPNTERPALPVTGGFELLGVFFPAYRIVIIALGAMLIAAVYIVVYRTSLGAMIRAAAYDRNMASSLGVPVSRVYSGTFAFGVALAGLSGVLLAPIFSVFPTMGHDFLVLAFTVVIVGGMGSIKGALIAGLLLTQVQAISALIISPVWTDPILFGIMVLVLMFRPQGLFGKLGHG
ncbi:MAG: branched-chain amino acid ABC transporter permease [Hyphomicrobiales bacterium]|nr:branched-chain amino acid ABC transporter permease [Hyphomicrobiales bacterium]